MKAVFDTSSLVKLQKGNCLDLIGKLFDIVFIPKAVRDEFTGSLDPSVFRIRDVTTELPIGLGQGRAPSNQSCEGEKDSMDCR